MLADDPELLEIASHARISAVMPAFLIGTAAYLYRLEPGPEGRAFFGEQSSASPAWDQYESFRDHCLRHRTALCRLLSSRGMQTNNLLRCAALFPALCQLRGRFPGQPCTLLDLGTSGGLHLLLDQYSYSYAELGGRVRDSPFRSHVDIEVQFSWRGRKPTDLRNFFDAPTIARRIGVDLNPIDLASPEERQWLSATSRLDDGIANAFVRLRELVGGVEMVTGDVIDQLRPLAETIPVDDVLVLMHSFLTVQFSPDEKVAFEAEIERLGSMGDVAVISLDNEMDSSQGVELWLRTYRSGERDDERLARCQYPLDSGTWLEWLGPI